MNIPIGPRYPITPQPLGDITIYAGLDVDAKPKMFVLDQTGSPVPIAETLWHQIIDALGARPGEMLIVNLSREP